MIAFELIEQEIQEMMVSGCQLMDVTYRFNFTSFILTKQKDCE